MMNCTEIKRCFFGRARTSARHKNVLEEQTHSCFESSLEKSIGSIASSAETMEKNKTSGKKEMIFYGRKEKW